MYFNLFRLGKYEYFREVSARFRIRKCFHFNSPQNLDTEIEGHLFHPFVEGQ